jgi:chain length determinant protein (polysaccharide antigen chain regulator)
LTEAAKIAESIGLVEKSALLENTVVNASERNAFYTEVNTQPQPLYLRGSKALRSEIKELTERSSDDPFIPGLRDLEDKVVLLKTNRQVEALKARQSNDPFIETLRDKESELAILVSFKIDPNQVSVATLDQAAYPPEKRESPKRAKIVALGALGGLFLGILAAFAINFWQSLRIEDEGAA